MGLGVIAAPALLAYVEPCSVLNDCVGGDVVDDGGVEDGCGEDGGGGGGVLVD